MLSDETSLHTFKMISSKLFHNFQIPLTSIFEIFKKEENLIKTNIKSPHNFFQYSNIIFQIMGRKIYILTFIIFWSGIIDIVGISMFAPLISTITENLSSNKITVATSQFFNF